MTQHHTGAFATPMCRSQLQHCYVLEPLPVPIIRLPGTTLSDVHPRNEIQVKNVQFLIGIGEMYRLNEVFCYTILGGKKWAFNTDNASHECQEVRGVFGGICNVRYKATMQKGFHLLRGWYAISFLINMQKNASLSSVSLSLFFIRSHCSKAFSRIVRSLGGKL
jgi:hypothetical protein